MGRKLGQEECHMLVEWEDLVHDVRVDELCTSQQEADTRILLHANHAAKEGNSCVVTESRDTDVAVLASSSSHCTDATLMF